jgi:mRNA interferase HigB
MEILNKEVLTEFSIKHPNARQPLSTWMDVVLAARWKNHVHLKTTFPSADLIGGSDYVFNIGGNNFRLLAAVSFTVGVVAVKWIKKHSDYDDWRR